MATSEAASFRRNFLFPLIVIGSLFFIFGFITWANSQLIPYLKIACELTDTQSFFVATAFFAAYFFMAIPSSYILNRTGFKNGMSLGLFVMAVGALVFIPAAQSRSYPMFLTGLFIIGTGLALLQTASNPYVTVLGPIESAAQRISFMGICNKTAGIIAVYVLGSIILKDVDELKARLAAMGESDRTAELNLLAERVINPYVFIAVALTVLAVIIYFLKLPEIREEEETDTSFSRGKTGIFDFPHLVLGAVAIFFYVGAEVISYDTFAAFGEFLGYPVETASRFAQYTGYGLLAGYVLGILTIPKLISQRNALFISAALSIVLVLIAMFTSGTVAVASFALLGFSQAIMWPAIWPLAINGLGRFTKIGAALLIMGIVGGALLPPLYGKFSEAIGSKQLGYALIIPSYLYILYYAWRGHKAGWKK
ncbi:MAG TPA: sugar MFS transporter [Chitinophagaceae bacterium]|nr:sugar MFS transporter [Chitinophagaceae bacterium]